MTDAPTRIWAWVREFEIQRWSNEQEIHPQHATKYTRADIAQAKIAELTEALALADGILSGANMNRAVVERKVRAALGDAA
jgi:hypothetical protein